MIAVLVKSITLAVISKKDGRGRHISCFCLAPFPGRYLFHLISLGNLAGVKHMKCMCQKSLAPQQEIHFVLEDSFPLAK